MLVSYDVDIAKEEVIYKQGIPLINRSIFRHGALYEDLFEGLKEFIQNQERMGDLILLPVNNVEIVVGYKEEQFYIYEIRSKRIIRRFRIGSFNQGKSDPPSKLSLFQVSPNGTYIVTVLPKSVNVKVIKVDEDFQSYFVPCFYNESEVQVTPLHHGSLLMTEKDEQEEEEKKREDQEDKEMNVFEIQEALIEVHQSFREE